LALTDRQADVADELLEFAWNSLVLEQVEESANLGNPQLITFDENGDVVDHGTLNEFLLSFNVTSAEDEVEDEVEDE
jgi:hypothetical protein